MSDMELVPLEQLIDTDEIYVCSKNLFSFVNRSLNNMGLQAKIIAMGDKTVFTVDKLRRD
jgi:hypothetical protein